MLTSSSLNTTYWLFNNPSSKSISGWTIQTLLWREYIRLEEEKDRKCGKVFNWETAKYGKIWYDEDIHDLRSIDTKFPAIAFNDEVSSERTLSCESTVSSHNDEIDFRVSFDDSDDKDYTVLIFLEVHRSCLQKERIGHLFESEKKSACIMLSWLLVESLERRWLLKDSHVGFKVVVVVE
nr:hypothetical protein [Tanacetum cinerariifolium]